MYCLANSRPAGNLAVECAAASTPDLALSEFCLFLLLEECLGGCQFVTDKDMKHTMNKWFSDQQLEFYAQIMEKLITCSDMCLCVFCDYMEK
jgi:hypothetical protein